ncbi:type II toxin-antitoxin system VapB family antitoxin [Hoeflea sp.]|nr:type II toxin-antitoxin system VapB family antitoxin [Hoeflea sp.]
MRTNIEIDDDLVADLMKLTGRKTKRQVVGTMPCVINFSASAQHGSFST